MKIIGLLSAAIWLAGCAMQPQTPEQRAFDQQMQLQQQRAFQQQQLMLQQQIANPNRPSYQAPSPQSTQTYCNRMGQTVSCNTY